MAAIAPMVRRIAALAPIMAGWTRSYSKNLAAMGIADDNLKISDEVLQKLNDPTLLHAAGYVGGEWVVPPKGSSFQVKNPATGQAIATLPSLNGDETRAAIAAADAIWPQWRAQTAKQRGAVLRRWYDEILKAADDLATIMTFECGKPLHESKAEIVSGAASVEWFAEECRRVCGDVLETVGRDRRMITLKQPVGVVGAITPWNFPMSMITRKVAPALAAGCTVVLKPAELTPLTALALAELGARAGLPDGTFNVVMGDAPAIGNALVGSEIVRKLGFTGSTAVGKQLAAGAAATVKRVSLELGGNAPFIVFEDADVARAASAIVGSALRNAGQTCICANRVFVHDAVYDAVSAAVAERVAALRVGSGLDPATTTGPLITPAALDKVESHVADAVAKGAAVVAGGGRPTLPAPLSGGNFFEPTLIRDATIDMRVFREETFGPLIPLFRFRDDDEAVMLANNTEYGLAAYFYTADLARAWRVAEALEYGMVGVNEVSITSEVAPFGGVKQSGLGREQSKYGLDEFMQLKYVCMGLDYDKSK